MSIDATENRRILIIDDNESLHRDYRKVLVGSTEDAELDELAIAIFGAAESNKVRQTPYELDSAFQGQEGLAKVQRSLEKGMPYAMAFIDMRMPPGWDGLTTIEEIWKVDPDLPVVICTAHSDHSWEDVLNRLGADDRWHALRKPFDITEVSRLAAALAEKRRLADKRRQKMPALSFDTAGASADKHDQDSFEGASNTSGREGRTPVWSV